MSSLNIKAYPITITDPPTVVIVNDATVTHDPPTKFVNEFE
jgi:hypothetical protein